MSWLYRYEAKSIQAYVMGTNRLGEIAGGSSLIADLPWLMRAQLCGQGREVQTAAGSATLLFESDRALQDFASEWPLRVAQHAPDLHLIQAWTRSGPGALEDLLSQKLPAARQRLRAQPFEPGIWVRRAARTGKPAVGRSRSRSGGEIDRGTASREDLGRKDARDRLEDMLLPERPGARFVSNHDDFGTDEDQNVAVVHIDGNAIGAHARGLDADAFQAFSERLSNATLAAARASLMNVPNTEGGRVLARPVVLGGDDYTVILRAEDAMTCVRAYLERFEQESGDLTATAGVAYVKLRSPFSAAYHLSEALCGAAKSALRGSGSPSAVLFHRVQSSVHTPWSEIQALELTTQTGRRLTRGPYRLDELAPLMELGRACRDLGSKGALREWVRLSKIDEPAADKRWRRLEEVQRRRGADGQDKWTALATALDALGAAGPWTPAGHTPILDAMTLNHLEGSA